MEMLRESGGRLGGLLLHRVYAAVSILPRELWRTGHFSCPLRAAVIKSRTWTAPK